MKILFLYLVFIFAGGCSVLDTCHSITIELPEIPDDFKDKIQPAYRLVYYSGGTRKERTIPPGDKSSTIVVENYETIPILVYPVNTETGDEYYPAGCFYTRDTIKRLAAPDWNGGFASLCVIESADRGWDCRSFDPTPLINGIKGKKRLSPWELDSRLIMETLINGSFSGKSMKKLPLWNISIPDAEGRWFMADFNYPPVQDSNGTLILENIPPGYHRIRQLQGNRKIHLYIQNNGDMLFFKTSS